MRAKNFPQHRLEGPSFFKQSLKPHPTQILCRGFRDCPFPSPCSPHRIHSPTIFPTCSSRLSVPTSSMWRWTIAASSAPGSLSYRRTAGRGGARKPWLSDSTDAHHHPTHITINLVPADLKKEGSGFDLPIAVGILGAYGALRIGHLGRFLFVGELGLDRRVRPIPAHRDPRARGGNSQSDPSRRERC